MCRYGFRCQRGNMADVDGNRGSQVEVETENNMSVPLQQENTPPRSGNGEGLSPNTDSDPKKTIPKAAGPGSTSFEQNMYKVRRKVD